MLKTITKTMREIIANEGYVTQKQLEILAGEYPIVSIGVKFGCSARFAVIAKDCQARIAERLAESSDDYVREVFLPCSTFDYIKGCIERENKEIAPTSPGFEHSDIAQACRMAPNEIVNQ